MKIRSFFNRYAKTFLALGALSVSSFASADDYSNSAIHYGNNHFDNNHFDRGCAPTCAPACESSCCGTPCNAAPECAWAYNLPAYPRCGCETSCCSNFLDSFAFRADFLWWRACEDGLELGREEYVNTFAIPGTTRDAVINRTHSKKPNFKYDPGFRIGLANACACDCWDFAVNWTHFHTKSSVNGASDESNGVTFFSNFERVQNANPTSARGRYSLNLDLVDIEFGRKFYVSSCFVLRPDFGLRVARIHQNYRVVSDSNLDSESCADFSLDYCDLNPLTNYQSDIKTRSNFLSIGPRVGLDIELHLGCGLTLFGQAAGSIVFGKFDNHSREELTNSTCNAYVGELNYQANSSAHRCSRTITDLAFGFKWDRCFEWCNRCHPVSLAFAWEHHGFYDMNNFNFASLGYNTCAGTVVGGNTTKGGDLYTQGLTVSLSLGF